MEIRILFEDEQIIVCEKPAGVAVQTKRLGQADMESLLKNRRAGKGELPYIGVVHRLDQPVSGVMVFAKTKEAAAALGRQIASGLADKFYYAVTDGVPEAGKGQFTDYLLRDGRTNTSAVVESSTPGAKRAELSYEVLEQKNGRAVLRIHLGTGRHHQIRWHDYQYGTTEKSIRKAVAKIGRDYMPMLFLVQFSDILSQNPSTFEGKLNTIYQAIEYWKKIIRSKAALELKDLEISGKDLIRLGVRPGPAIGALLKQLLEEVLDEPAYNRKDRLLERAQTLMHSFNGNEKE